MGSGPGTEPVFVFPKGGREAPGVVSSGLLFPSVISATPGFIKSVKVIRLSDTIFGTIFDIYNLINLETFVK